MKAALAVAALRVFSFATAANVNVTKNRRGDGVWVDKLIPDCVKMDTIFKDKDIVTVNDVYNAGDCGSMCSLTSTCQMWSYHDPKPLSPPSKYPAYACILKGDSAHFAEEERAGFLSGKRGCRNDRSSHQIPICAEKNVLYEGEEIVVSPRIPSASSCGAVCDKLSECMFWSYFRPTKSSPSSQFSTEDCILRKGKTLEKTHEGFHSGKRGCK